jgi:NAD-dependent SIR2 family protein deacetylase
MKPEVVFFGENVPKAVVDDAMNIVKEEADAMLVIGTSLMVYSAFRFVKAAHEKGIPIAAVNVGPTRADDILKVKIEALCGEFLPLVNKILLH